MPTWNDRTQQRCDQVFKTMFFYTHNYRAQQYSKYPVVQCAGPLHFIPVKPAADRKSKLNQGYLHTRSVRRVAEQQAALIATLKHDPRTVLPAAELARLFNISTRLMWTWLAEGLIQRQRPRDGCKHSKRGVLKRHALSFLKELATIAEEFRSEAWISGGRYRSLAGRPSRAQEAISKQSWTTTSRTKNLTIAEFARLSGTSASSVRRAITDGRIDAYRSSPKRWRIGKKPRRKG